MAKRSQSTRTPSDTTQRTPRDERLAAAVRSALLDDLAVPDTTLRVSVSDGEVLLAGTVTCDGERREAERTAASVAGVRSVRNEIGVWPPDVESELVRETTRELLAARGAVDGAGRGEV